MKQQSYFLSRWEIVNYKSSTYVISGIREIVRRFEIRWNYYITVELLLEQLKLFAWRVFPLLYIYEPTGHCPKEKRVTAPAFKVDNDRAVADSYVREN